jgi:hypothetical protein
MPNIAGITGDPNLAGVFGENTGDGGVGVAGVSRTGDGVRAVSANGNGLSAFSTTGTGIFAKGSVNAGFFEGNVVVTGRLFAPGGIDGNLIGSEDKANRISNILKSLLPILLHLAEGNLDPTDLPRLVVLIGEVSSL